MARSFLTPIDLNGFELRNATFQNLGVAPSGPGPGRQYWDTSLGIMRWYGASGAWINPLDRAGHTGNMPAANVTGLVAVITAQPLSTLTAPTSNIAMAGFTLTGLPAPTGPGQPVEYTYLQNQIEQATAGIASRPPVRAVSQANIATLSGVLTVDGVSLVAGDRLLLTGQTTASQNGVYIVSATAWSRAPDYNQANELIAGATWLVTEGTASTGATFRQTTTGVVTLGTTNISIVQSNLAVSYTAINGVQLNSGVFSLKLPAVSGLIADTTGVYLDVTVAVRKFGINVGDGASLSYVVAHNLNNLDAMVQVYQTALPRGTVEVDIQRTDANTVTVVFGSAPAAGAYRVIVQG